MSESIHGSLYLPVDLANEMRDAAERRARASTEAIPFQPRVQYGFGSGVGNQPDTATLLRESRGVFDYSTRAIANRVAELEYEVVVTRRVVDGTNEEEVLDDHVLADLLAVRPHPNITSAQLRRLTVQWIITTGRADWLKVGNGFGVPAELHPIPPTSIAPVWRSGVIDHFIVRDGDGADHRLDPDCIVHFGLLDPENYAGFEGYLAPSGITADTLKFAGQHVREHFRNDATPKTVLKSGSGPGTPEERHAFDAQFIERYNSRTGSARGVPIKIGSEDDLIQFAMQSGADIVPLLDWLTTDSLMGTGTPRSVLGQVVSGDRSSAETNQYVFDRYTVKPVATLVSDALTLNLAPDFDAALSVRFKEFVSADKEFELKREEQDLRTMKRSINKVLTDAGEDPVAWGDNPVGTLAQVPYDPTAVVDDLPSDDPDAFDDDRAAARSEQALLTHQVGDEVTERAARVFSARAEWQRQVNREKQYVPKFTQGMRKILNAQRDETVKRAIAMTPRSRISADDVFDERAWDELFKALDAQRETAFIEIVQATLPELGGVQEFLFTPEMERVLREQGAKLITQANATTKQRLAATLAEATAEGESIDQIGARIRRVFKVRKAHARTIARTEILKASQSAQVTSYDVSGVVDGKRWNTSLDAAVRDEHISAEGQEVTRGESFTLGDGESADAPGIGAGGGTLSAGNSINCRCFVTPVFT